jgi:alkylhydroperoxidase/carboxymuconolactone decarboxylase family protein YurZ
MKTIEQTEARRRQAHRRLNELEIAVGVGGRLDLAWHIAQAARSGASHADVLDAVKQGVKRRGTPTAVLAQCNDLVKRVFNERGASWPTRKPTVESLSQC